MLRDGGEPPGGALATGPIRIVFFDLGGTLLDFRDPIAWSEVAREVGYPEEPEHLAHAVAEVERRADRLDRFGPSEFWRQVLQVASGREVPLPDGERFLSRWVDRPRPGRVFSDVDRCLAELRADHRRLGVISNSRSIDAVRRRLDEAGLAGVFDPIVSSGTEGVEKPDRRIFTRAVELAGVRPSEAFHVGDLPVTDAEGAAAAGLHAVWLHRDGTGTDGPVAEITSLSELPAVVRDIRARPVK